MGGGRGERYSGPPHIYYWGGRGPCVKQCYYIILSSMICVVILFHIMFQFKGLKSLRCNHGTDTDEAFHNSNIVSEITRDPSLKTFINRRIDIPNHGYVTFDAKSIHMFCGNKMTHQRERSYFIFNHGKKSWTRMRSNNGDLIKINDL